MLASGEMSVSKEMSASQKRAPPAAFFNVVITANEECSDKTVLRELLLRFAGDEHTIVKFMDENDTLRGHLWYDGSTLGALSYACYRFEFFDLEFLQQMLSAGAKLDPGPPDEPDYGCSPFFRAVCTHPELIRSFLIPNGFVITLPKYKSAVAQIVARLPIEDVLFYFDHFNIPITFSPIHAATAREDGPALLQEFIRRFGDVNLFEVGVERGTDGKERKYTSIFESALSYVAVETVEWILSVAKENGISINTAEHIKSVKWSVDSDHYRDEEESAKQKWKCTRIIKLLEKY